jgi:hypothetical protein
VPIAPPAIILRCLALGPVRGVATVMRSSLPCEGK